MENLFVKYLKYYKNKSQEIIKKDVFNLIEVIRTGDKKDDHFIYFTPLIVSFLDGHGSEEELGFVDEINNKFNLGFENVDDVKDMSAFVNENIKPWLTYILEKQDNPLDLNFLKKQYDNTVKYIIACLSYKKVVAESELEQLNCIAGIELTGKSLSYDASNESKTINQASLQSNRSDLPKTKTIKVDRGMDDIVCLDFPIRKLKTKDGTIYDVPIVNSWELLYAVGFYSWIYFSEDLYSVPKEGSIDFDLLYSRHIDEVEFFEKYLMFNTHNEMSFNEAMKKMISYPLNTSNDGCSKEDAFVMNGFGTPQLGFSASAIDLYEEKSLSGINSGLFLFTLDPDPGSFNMETKLHVLPLLDGVINAFDEGFFNNINPARVFVEVDGTIYLIMI